VVGVRRAAVDDARGVGDEDVGRGLGAPGPRDLLGLIVQVRGGELARLDARPHRLDRIARVLLAVVGVDLQDAHAAVGIVAGDGLDTVVPGERVRTVVAGEDDHRRAGAVLVQGSRGSGGIREREIERHGGPQYAYAK
jgi:hypothetical protein